MNEPSSELNLADAPAVRNLDIQSAAALHRALVEALAQGVDTIDLSAVESCDAIGLQLLFSAHRSAQLAGLPFAVDHVPAAVIEAAAAAGLSLDELTGAAPGGTP